MVLLFRSGHFRRDWLTKILSKIQASSFILPEVAIRSKAADLKLRTESQK